MFRINGLVYPVEKRFGRSCKELVEKIGEEGLLRRRVCGFETKEIPFKIFLKEFMKLNKRKIFDKDFEQTLKFLLSDGDKENPDKFEVMISINKKFTNKTVFSKISTFQEFIEYNGILNIYIAQYPIFKKMKFSDFHNIEENTVKKKLQKLIKKKNTEGLKKILEKFILPEFLLEKFDKLERVNLWCGKKKTISKLHFDFYSNYLLVLKGKKTVYLFPPNCPIVENSSINFQTFHEGNLKKRKKFKKNLININSKIKKSEFLWKNGMLKVEIREGEAVHIPEGWYHYVISEENTIAINFWFESIFVKIEKNEENIRNYLVLKKLKENLKDISVKSIKNSGHSIEKFEVKKIKRSIIELIMDKVLKFKDFVGKDISVKKKLFLNYLLNQLEESDQKINAKKFIFEEENKVRNKVFDHTDETKEIFYEFFGIYFGEEERVAAVKIQEELIQLMLKSDIKSFIEGIN